MVLSELGNAEKIARDPAAVVHLQQAWQATSEPLARARLAGQLADTLYAASEFDRCLAVLQTELDAIHDHDPSLAAQLHAFKAYVDNCSVHPTEAPEVALDQLRDLASGDSPARRFAQLLLAIHLSTQGECRQRVIGLVEGGWDESRFLTETVATVGAVALGITSLIYVDELDRADALVEVMQADARARGSVLGFASASALRGAIGLRRGALADAEADARVALELVTEHHLPIYVAWHAAVLGLILLERGDIDQAAAVVEKVKADPDEVSVPVSALLLGTRGRVRLARGQRELAIRDLRYCGQLADHGGWHNPNYVPWRSTLALALAPAQSKEAWELAQTELQLARRADSSRAIGIALRVCGLLIGDKNGIELLKQSVTVLQPTDMQLELAYSLTELGAALRRTGARNAAREPLHRALDLADRCGAAPLAERARQEALAAGARPRRPWISGVHALTPSELRVARLAAQSLSNRDIAQALFITTKTVSDHLSSTYRKLNIHTRDQLATAIETHASPDSIQRLTP
jgi:ATP/maltotriose-dependent transcriptional regulator MalT